MAAEGVPQVVKCSVIVVGVVYGSYSGIYIFLIAQVRHCDKNVLQYTVTTLPFSFMWGGGGGGGGSGLWFFLGHF